MNTHFGVVYGSVPPTLEIIACGGADFCEESLARWVETHPLQEFQTAEILQRIPRTGYPS